MLSVHRIQREFEGHRYEAMLRAIAAQLPFELPMSLWVRLTSTTIAPTALALRRLIDLTYGPTTLSKAMTAHLLSQQEADGSFGNDPLATAAGAAAMIALLDPHHGSPSDDAEPSGGFRAGYPGTLQEKLDAALHALSYTQHTDPEEPLFQHPDDRTLEERALVSAFILALLAPDARFRASVRFAELMDWYEGQEGNLPEVVSELIAMARVGSRPTPRPSRSLAAIAA